MGSNVPTSMGSSLASNTFRKLTDPTPAELVTPESIRTTAQAPTLGSAPQVVGNGSQSFANSEDDELHVRFNQQNTEILQEIINTEHNDPDAFWSKLEEYHIGLTGLLDYGSTGVSINDRLVNLEDQAARMKLVESVEEHWSEAATNDLLRHASLLEARVRSNPLITHEYDFFRLGKRILYAVGGFPPPDFSIDRATWTAFTPICTTPATQEIIDRVRVIYNEFQQNVYLDANTDEKLTLWYLISTNMKQVFYEMSSHHWNSDWLLFPLEKEFINHAAHKELYQYTSSRLDISCPQEMEDLVAEYCKFIHHRVGWKLAAVASAGLDKSSVSVLTQLDTSIEQNQDTLLATALHKAVIRLNCLLGEPKVLRRLGRSVTFFLADQALQDDLARDQGMFLDELVPKKPLLPEWHQITDNVLSTSLNDDLEVEVSVDESANAGNLPQPASLPSYVPRGRNILSAHDYVYCPFPENRAYEVAHSRMITRDLREPGIISEGLRVDDLVNLPPLHCRTPGTWTLWKKRIPLGPYEVFRLIGSTIKTRLWRPKTMRRPGILQPPNNTPRDRYRHHKHQKKRAAQKNAGTRATKPVPRPLVRLRGGAGGPRFVSNPDSSPSRPPRQHNNPRQAVTSPSIPSTPSYCGSSGGSNNENRSQSPDDQNDGERVPLRDITAAVVSGIGDDIWHASNDEEEPVVQCHPCPFYKDQYHHNCPGDASCPGLVIGQHQYDGMNEADFFNGSLWQKAGREWHRVEGEIRSTEEFVERFRWQLGPGHTQFGLSNGATIQVQREAGDALLFHFDGAPRPEWEVSRTYWHGVPEGQFLDALPEDTQCVRVRRPGDNQWSDTPYNSHTHIDVLMSPEWETNTLFRIYCGDDGSERLNVRLERADVLPREALVIILPFGAIVYTGQQTQAAQNVPQEPHPRHYNAPDPRSGEATADSQANQQALQDFQQRLSQVKKNQKQQNTQTQAQKQNDQAQAGPSSQGLSNVNPFGNVSASNQLQANQRPTQHASVWPPIQPFVPAPAQQPVQPDPIVAANIQNLMNIGAARLQPTPTAAPPGKKPGKKAATQTHVPSDNEADGEGPIPGSPFTEEEEEQAKPPVKKSARLAKKAREAEAKAKEAKKPKPKPKGKGQGKRPANESDEEEKDDDEQDAKPAKKVKKAPAKKPTAKAPAKAPAKKAGAKK